MLRFPKEIVSISSLRGEKRRNNLGLEVAVAAMLSHEDYRQAMMEKE